MDWPLNIDDLDLYSEMMLLHTHWRILEINWLFRNPAPTIWREVFPTELLSHELRSTVSLSEFNGKVRYYIFWLKHGILKMQL